MVPHVRRTPVLRSGWLSELAGGDVYLKCENLQRTGSFKVRGGFAALALDPRPVVAASAGNHGQGLALAARTFGVPCTIVVPRTIPRGKEEAIRALGATVVKAPFDGYDDTEAWTRERTAAFGGDWVSPFDDPYVVAGNGGTTALEIFEDLGDLDALVVPCGGGGCAIGCGIAARGRARVVGVNTDASPGMALSRRDGRARLRVESAPTIAEGIEGGVSERSFALASRFVDDVVVVREATIRRAVAETLRHERMLVEGAGAAGVAAILEGLKGRRICVILTGSNLDRERVVELLGSPYGPTISENPGRSGCSNQ